MPHFSAVVAHGVCKYFGPVVALDEVALEVEAGQVHGLVGPNGAGKTTLLGLLLGLATADSGRLEILGTPVGRGLGVAEGVAGFVDAPGLYPSLTARQNLAAVVRLRGGTSSGGVDEALERVGLTDVADDRVRGFSLGMRQRLGLAAALLDPPRLLVLDEPANGLDPAGKRHVHRVIGELSSEGTAVVLSSHHMDELAVLCSEVTILDTGHVVFTGPVSALASRSGDLDYRLVTSDAAKARSAAAADADVRLRSEEAGRGAQPNAIVVRASVTAIEKLVRGLVYNGLAIRELAPLVSPLEAAFLALTGEADGGTGPAEKDAPVDDMIGAAR